MREIRAAEIIAVGSELLTAHRSDTNSLYLTEQLNAIGVDVRRKAIVGDRRDDVGGAVRDALERVDLVLLTGGLGPTDDDITREAVAGLLKLPLAEDAAILETISTRFARRGLRMPEINRRQAQVPRGATVLPNPAGTAPGLWIDAGDRVVVLMPGPPREMRPMFESHVRPVLALRTGGRQVRRRVIKITGRAESLVDEAAQPLYSKWVSDPIPIDTTILAASGQIELHVSSTGADTAEVDRVLDDAVQELAAAIGSAVFSVDGRSLEEVVGKLLLDHHARIAVAESCTGGLVLTRLTSVPGSSGWVQGGLTAYANDVKIDLLGVPADLIAAHGAVSEPVAAAMARGVRERFGVDVGVSVTGIAGPSGGSDAKPVGTVCLAIDGPARLSKTVLFTGDRHIIRAQAAQAVLDLVRRAYLDR
jgi:nicotinamide-nucleotide amidase